MHFQGKTGKSFSSVYCLTHLTNRIGVIRLKFPICSQASGGWAVTLETVSKLPDLFWCCQHNSVSGAVQHCQFLHVASQIHFSNSGRGELCETSAPPSLCSGVGLKKTNSWPNTALAMPSSFPSMFSTYGCEIQCLTSLNIESSFF